MVKLPVYVISLACAQDRRAFMHGQLAALGIEYQIFEAVHGSKTPDHPLFKKYNDRKRARLRGRNASLRLSQLGCFASHYLLWQRCVERAGPIVILEDDAILLPLFAQFYEQAADLADRHGMVWLQPSRKEPNSAGLAVDTVGPFTVRKFAKGFSGTTGYVLHPRSAQALLDYCGEWLYPVDNTMDRFFEHHVEAIGLDPPCIQQEDDFESAINIPDDGYRRSLADKLRREWSSLGDNWKRSMHNLRFRIRHAARGGRT